MYSRGQKLDGLEERTGVRALCFIARGNMNDPARSECLHTGGVAEFISAIFKMSMAEYLYRFEMFCAMVDTGEPHCNGYRHRLTAHQCPGLPRPPPHSGGRS